MGAGAPSDEQIEMIYNQEKHLFEENAEFLLPDSNVQDVDFDDIEKTLVVATTLGVNKYKDLIRISEVEFEKPDGPTILPISNANAVSANDGAVAVTTSSEGGIALPELNIREEFTKIDGMIPDPDGETKITEALFAPIDPPTVAEGKVFYDQNKHALSVYSDVDMTLNLGQEEIIRVLNNSGAVIPNATPVYVTGASGGLPTIDLAQANLYSTASVPGVTTHEILNGEEGFITHAGTTGGDFSTFAVGDLLYVSETVAGEMVTVAPDIVTKLGFVVDNTADGSMIVKIASLVQLPNVIGYMSGGAVPGTISTTITDIDTYTTSGNIVSTINAAAGTINTPSTGTYRLGVNLNIAFTPENSLKVLTIHLTESDNTPVLTFNQTLSKNTESASFVISVPFDATSGKVAKLRISSDDDITGVTADLMSFDIESINIR